MIILLLVAVVAGFLQRAGMHGANVLLIEGNEIGGTCVNVGCVPKSHVASQQHDGNDGKRYSRLRV